MSKELKWASFVSGGGTTMREMALATQRGEVSRVKLDLVISSSARAGAIQKARELGLEPGQVVVINPNDYRGEDGEVDQDGFGRKIITELKGRNIDFFTQNGWLKRTPPRVSEEFEGYNQHPQRPDLFGGPGMYGLRPHAARLSYAYLTGEENPEAIPVVQRVAPNYDEGAVVVFDSVGITESLSKSIANGGAADLQKAVLPYEHQVNIELLKQVSAGTVHDLALPEVQIPFGRERSVGEYADIARTVAITLFPHA